MRLENYTLLIVDDNPDNLDMLSRRLIRQGYQVEVAEGGRKALELIQNQKYDLILLDIMMPEVDGFQVLTTLRKTHTITDLPIIMATAKHQSLDIIEALKLGANDYITKPFDFPVLLARMQTHLTIRQLAQLKDEFLRIASHDLKNPLWSVQTAAQMVEELVPVGAEMTPQAAKMLALVSKQTQEMQRIVEDFLDFQSAEDGQLMLNLAPTDLNEVASRAVEINLEYAHKKGTDLQLELEPNLPQIKADKARLGQVVTNFIGNAIKFSSKGATPPMVRTCAEAEVVVLEVIDAGPGLTEEDLKKVFAKYARLSNRPTGGEKSSGLGLAICKQMIELHGGQIGVHNNADQGSTFWFRLPIKA
jgi:two-component system, sensor histidine kinase and response regulator